MEQKATQQPEQMPENIGRYQVREGVGFGAMGAVYKAFDPVIKRTLAIKTIRLDIPRQSPQYKSFIERFYHEARISGTLSHPNIVTLFDIGEENGVPYLAMEYVDGQTVAALIEAGHRFKPERVISLASQIASAIDYAHGKGVIHRDIKPSNLILYEEDRVKVTDFGIAKLADADMTQSGTLLGTPSYMSPEQAMGDKLDGRSDIFSLGVCCFEMLSGEQPFPGANVTSILYKLVHVDPVEPANLEMSGLVPQKWHEVFGRALAKRPDDRYQTATAFVQELEFCLGAWFGGVGAEQTLPGAEVPTPTVSMQVAQEAPAEAAASEELPATVVMKVQPPAPVPPPPDASGELPTLEVRPPAPATDGDTATVVMKAAPAPAPAPEPATVILRASPAPPPPTPPRSAAASPAPPAPPPAAPSEPASPDGSSATVTVKVPKAAAPPVRPAPKTPPPAPVEEPTLRVESAPTVRMAAPPPLPPTPPPLPGAPAPVQRTAEAPITQPVAPVVPGAPPRRGGVPPALVIGGGALALALGLGVAWLLLRSDGEPAKVASPSPAPVAEATAPPETVPSVPAVPADNGVLTVESVPPGAVVTVNGQSQGTSPIEMTGLAPGEYAVRLELRGYEAKTQTLTLTREVPRGDLKVALVRQAPTTGSADILSTPLGAAVTVDGAAVGQTPLLQLRLKPGTRKVEVTKEGYEPWSSNMVVEAGKKARLEASLTIVVKATPPPVPTPEPVDASRVYANASSEVDTLARRVSGSSPTYPQEAGRMRTGDSRSVVVSFVVTEEGDVADTNVVESGGSRVLDEAVLAAVRSWKFSPAVKRGIKVKVRITHKQTFRAG